MLNARFDPRTQPTCRIGPIRRVTVFKKLQIRLQSQVPWRA